MSDFKFGDLLKPGQATKLALQRELEHRRDGWTRPGYHYKGAGDFLLQHGQFYGEPAEFRDPPGQTCFHNALVTAEQEGLRYCEGLYSISGSYLAHAWCLRDDDRVVEVTQPDVNALRAEGVDVRSVSQLPLLPNEQWGYWGVVLPTELIRWHSETYRVPESGEPSYCLFDRAPHEGGIWREMGMPEMAEGYRDVHDWPILKQPFDPRRTSL